MRAGLRLRNRSRGAAILICVLVCLAVTAAMMLTNLRVALRARRADRINHQMRQTYLLLDAGIRRAYQQVGVTPDYRGETWRPDLDSQLFDGAVVEIHVASSPGDAQARQVDVTARIENGGLTHLKTQRSRSLMIQLAQSPSTE